MMIATTSFFIAVAFLLFGLWLSFGFGLFDRVGVVVDCIGVPTPANANTNNNLQQLKLTGSFRNSKAAVLTADRRERRPVMGSVGCTPTK
jgi:hypothetical protein